MPNPVPIPAGALVIDEPTNASAEALVAAIARAMKYGITGASVLTPPALLPSTNPPMNSLGHPVLQTLSLDTAEKQLYHRQLAAAIISVIGEGGTGGTGPHTHPEVLPTVYTLATRPAAEVGLRGHRIILSDPSYLAGADVLQICLRNSDGSYTWVDSAIASF